MTNKRPGYIWKLRQLMAMKGLYKTSDLGPLLADRGVVLSAAQVYRLVAKAPERLSLHTLAALCDILSCTPNDLIELTAESRPKVSSKKVSIRPRRARVTH
jgi:DNA-binding Xre family transcriptional regulator